MERYVVLGASAAGCNAVREIRRMKPEDEIILVSTDTAIYSRCILYHHLKGIRNLEELNFMEADFEEKYKVNWKKGRTAVSVDIHKNEVTLDDGSVVGYDQLLIATGSHTNFPPTPGIKEGTNIVGFRNFDDVEKIESLLPEVENIFIMGASLVGVDAAAGLLPHHKNVSICGRSPIMLPRQLDKETAKTYEDLFAKEGVKQYYGTVPKEYRLDENKHCYEVELENGTVIPVDLVINCAGVRPNVEFLKDSGIECDRYGLVYDVHGRTNVPNVFGAGDVSGRAPIWPVAVKEGLIAANNMCGGNMTMDDFFASKATMNFLGVPTLSVGDPGKYDDTYSVVIDRDKKGNYKKIVYKDGVITGALIQGDLSYAGVLTQLIRRKIDVSRVKKPLFKIDYSDFFRMGDNFEFTYEKEYTPEE